MVLYRPLFAGLDGVVVKKTYSIVDLSTRYELDGLGFESWKEKRFIFVLNCPDRRWGTLSLIFNGYRVSFPRIKRPGRKVEHTLSYSAEIFERVQLFLCPLLRFRGVNRNNFILFSLLQGQICILLCRFNKTPF